MGSAAILGAVFILLFAAGVASRPTPRRKLFFPGLVTLYACIFLFPAEAKAFSISIYISAFLAYASDLILLSEPQILLKREGQQKPVAEMSLPERLSWAITLVIDLRGVQWSCEIPNLRRSSLPRWSFVKSKLGAALLAYITRDITFFCIHHNPAFNRINGEPFGAHGFLWQIWNVFVFWVCVGVSMYLAHSVAAAVAVAAGLSAPRDWPDLFGPWLRTTSVRKFWGKSWHQMMRRPVTGNGKYLARNVLKFKAGSSPSSYTQLYVAFLLSGIIHAAGVWTVLKRFTSVRWTVQYYLMQAMVITIEDVVIAGGKKIGISHAPSILSYSWVIWWLAWSGPTWIEPMVQAGFVADMPRISYFQRLLTLLGVDLPSHI